MKLSGKIDRLEDLKTHFQELSDFQVPIRLFDKKGKFFAKGRFVYENNGALGLYLSPIPLNWSAHAVLSCNYSLKDKSCAFQTRPINTERNYLHLEMPRAVLLFERRKYFRITPSDKEPVVVRLSIPEKGEIRVRVSDFSGGGFSVLVPRRMDFFNAGMTMAVTIQLSDEESIKTQATIKGLYSFLAVTRIGCEFSRMSENDQEIFSSYVMRRQLVLRHRIENTENKNWQKPTVCIVDTGQNDGFYSYLKELFDIQMVDYLNAISHLRSQLPEMIVLNTSHAGTKIVAQTVTRDKLLRELPLVLVGKPHRVKGRSGPVMTVKAPYHPAYLIKSMKELIEKVRLSQQIARSYWQYFMGNGKKIMIVDPQKNLGPIPFDVLADLEYQLYWIKGEAGIIGQIEQAHPDVLLLDSETGGMDTATLCRLINLNKAVKSIPKIRIIPGGAVPESSLFENTGIHFLVKPFDANQLIQEVNKALGRAI